jgi:hypothetical protein
MEDTVKKEKIKALAERVGQSRAEKFWALFVERLCDGIEPEVGDTFKREDIEKRFENNPVARDAFVAVFCGDQKETPKGKKYKAGRPYGAAEYSAFYAKTPEDVALVADIARATDGKAWVIAAEGMFCEGPSAKFIQWHMDQDIAPATIDVDGVPVAPVLPGQEKAPKEAYVDPSAVGKVQADGDMVAFGQRFVDHESHPGTAEVHPLVRETHERLAVLAGKVLDHRVELLVHSHDDFQDLLLELLEDVPVVLLGEPGGRREMDG